MSTSVVIFALAACILGRILSWYLTRDWEKYCAKVKTLVFPRVCPICLSAADEAMEEESATRQTANYVIARKLEWWRASVPHCSKCKGRQQRNELIGVVAGGVCVLAAVVLAPPTEPSLLVFVYILFGYPAYIVASTLQKGAVFGSADAENMMIRVRSKEYFAKLIRANATSAATEIPLANNGGVWRR